jgi:hypothetical protein
MGQPVESTDIHGDFRTPLISFDCRLPVRPNCVVYHMDLGRTPACD